MATREEIEEMWEINRKEMWEINRKRYGAFVSIANLLEDSFPLEAIQKEYDKYSGIIGERDIDPLGVIKEAFYRHKKWCMDTFAEMERIINLMESVREFERNGGLLRKKPSQ